MQHIESKFSKDSVIGVGTGTTVNFFINELAKVKHKFDCVVSSSAASTRLLGANGIKVIDLNASPEIELYVDGADEANKNKELIKGGGGALTQEKIVAQASTRFFCMIDQSKLVTTLGKFPLPVEVIPSARSLVGRHLLDLGATPIWRQDFKTDNDNLIIDAHGLSITEPAHLEQTINNIPGVVCNGLFALRTADTLLVSTSHGIELF